MNHIVLLMMIFICVDSKITLEWTEETLAEKPSDFIYDKHLSGMNFPVIGEFSKNAFAIVNLKAPSDLFITDEIVFIDVETKKGEKISKKSPRCRCSFVEGNGLLLCDFDGENEQFDTIKILDNKENYDIEFDLGNFDTIIDICNGIYGDNNNNDNNNSDNNNNEIIIALILQN